MGLYKNTNGVLTPIAGRGRAEYGASTIRKGTIVIPKYEDGDNIGKSLTVTFDTPMPDSDYMLDINSFSNYNIYTIAVLNKTANGFTLLVRLSFAQSTTITGTANSRNLYYTAFKLYTDTEYNEVLERTDANSFGTIVPLTYDTDYVCPSDGYLSVVVPAGSVGTAIGVVNGEWFVEAQTDTVQSDVKFSCVFVKKGMTVKVIGTSATVSKANFVPLV